MNKKILMISIFGAILLALFAGAVSALGTCCVDGNDNGYSELCYSEYTTEYYCYMEANAYFGAYEFYDGVNTCSLCTDGPPNPTGTCCVDDTYDYTANYCYSANVYESDCSYQATFYGSGVYDFYANQYDCGLCAPAEPTGACCYEGGCAELTEADCYSGAYPGANWLGDGSICETDCYGACCYEEYIGGMTGNHICEWMNFETCDQNMGAREFTYGTQCTQLETGPCAKFGACCAIGGGCLQADVTEFECAILGGGWYYDQPCDAGTCGLPPECNSNDDCETIYGQGFLCASGQCVDRTIYVCQTGPEEVWDNNCRLASGQQPWEIFCDSDGYCSDIDAPECFSNGNCINSRGEDYLCVMNDIDAPANYCLHRQDDYFPWFPCNNNAQCEDFFNPLTECTNLDGFCSAINGCVTDVFELYPDIYYLPEYNIDDVPVAFDEGETCTTQNITELVGPTYAYFVFPVNLDNLGCDCSSGSLFIELNVNTLSPEGMFGLYQPNFDYLNPCNDAIEVQNTGEVMKVEMDLNQPLYLVVYGNQYDTFSLTALFSCETFELPSCTTHQDCFDYYGNEEFLCADNYECQHTILCDGDDLPCEQNFLEPVKCEDDFGESYCIIDRCGNGVLDEDQGEQCDGTDFGTASCTDYGFTGGDLVCNADCTIDSSECADYEQICIEPLVMYSGVPTPGLNFFGTLLHGLGLASVDGEIGLYAPQNTASVDGYYPECTNTFTDIHIGNQVCTTPCLIYDENIDLYVDVKIDDWYFTYGPFAYNSVSTGTCCKFTDGQYGPIGECVGDYVTQSQCDTAGGQFSVEVHDCSVCDRPTGACCYTDEPGTGPANDCYGDDLTENECYTIDNQFAEWFEGADCGVCLQEQIGACCFEDGCYDGYTSAVCYGFSMPGINWLGQGSTCYDDCFGTCCSGGFYQGQMSYSSCETYGSYDFYYGIQEPERCTAEPEGACCYPGGCAEMSFNDCQNDYPDYLNWNEGEICEDVCQGACCFNDCMGYTCTYIDFVSCDNYANSNCGFGEGGFTYGLQCNQLTSGPCASQQEPEEGACCFEEGCYDSYTSDDCYNSGQSNANYLGDGTNCYEDCYGTCCYNGGFVNYMSYSSCDIYGATDFFYGLNQPGLCSGAEPEGACCYYHPSMGYYCSEGLTYNGCYSDPYAINWHGGQDCSAC